MSGSPAAGAKSHDPLSQTIGTSYGAAGTFYGAVTVNGRPQFSWPHRVGVVPTAAPGRLYRPTDDELERALSVSANAGQNRACQVLSGLGGVGKTQLAAALAERWWQRQQIDLLLWAPAGSRASVIARFAQAASEITGIDHTDPQVGAERLLAWLSNSHIRWLVILDDLNDPADLSDLWPPRTISGHTIVTTRRRDAALLDGRALIDVGVFTEVEAATYLARKLGDRPGRLAQAESLAEDLGRLPLALAQATAYIVDQGLSCADYRRRLTRRRLATLAPNALPDDQRKAVADTWVISIDLADSQQPAGLARPILELVALLEPGAIPMALFVTDAVMQHCAARVGRPVDAEDTHDAVRVLARLSLLTTVDIDDTLRAHALVQRAIREATEPSRLRQVAWIAADGLCEIWPEAEHSSARGQLLRANATALYRCAGSSLVGTDGHDTHPLLFRIGRSLAGNGLLAAAVEHFRDLRGLVAAQLGGDHHEVLDIRMETAELQGHMGSRRVAVDGLGAVLADRITLLGKDHLDTLRTRHLHAHWQGHAGDPVAARSGLEEVVVDLLRVVGPDHPETLVARGNLAHWRGEAGDAAGAIEAMEAVLNDRIRALGADHPRTMIARMSLAFWRGQAGSPGRALRELDLVLDDQLRVLDPSHPDVFTTRSNIAHWRGQAGDVAGAVEGFRGLLADRLVAVGPEHPRTLLTQGNLAHWLGRSGDPTAAVALLEWVVEHQYQLFGADHRDALGMRGSLGHWRGRAGDPARAVHDLEAVKVDQVRVLGPDHLDTRNTEASLRYWLSRRDGREAAEPASLVEVTGRRRHVSE